MYAFTYISISYHISSLLLSSFEQKENKTDTSKLISRKIQNEYYTVKIPQSRGQHAYAFGGQDVSLIIRIGTKNLTLCPNRLKFGFQARPP